LDDRAASTMRAIIHRDLAGRWEGACRSGVGCCSVLASAELYDPAAGLGRHRSQHRTLFAYGDLAANDNVLFAGDLMQWRLRSAELYDPARDWMVTGSLTPHASITRQRAGNGKVLAAGGSNNSGYLASAELYDSTAMATPTRRLALRLRQRDCTASPSRHLLQLLQLRSHPHNATPTPTGTPCSAGDYTITRYRHHRPRHHRRRQPLR